VSGREETEPYVHADVAVGEVLVPCACDVVAVGGALEPCRSTTVGAVGTLLKHPDPLGLKCDTITSPRRLVITFITSNSYRV
jgi:hypothetical protein